MKLVRRPRSALRQAAVALIAGSLALGAVACTSDPTTSSPSQTSRTRPLQTPRPPSVPMMPSGSATPKQSFNFGTGTVVNNSPRVGRSGDTTIVLDGNGAVSGVDRTGRQLWKVQEPSGMYSSWVNAVIDNDVVLVTWPITNSYDYPRRIAIRAVDAASGRVMWQTDDDSDVTSVVGTTWTSRCTPEQNTTLGNCTVSARDPRTGTVRWQQPEYASARIDTVPPADIGSLQAPPAPEVLLVHSSPSGNPSSQFRAHDVRTGQPLGFDLAAYNMHPGPVVQQGPGIAVTYGGGDDDARDGCTGVYTVTTQEAVWTRPWPTETQKVDGDHQQCRPMSMRQLTPTLSAPSDVADDLPFLVDLRTGETVWQGEQKGVVKAATDDIVVTQIDDGGTIAAWDLSSGIPRWSVKGGRSDDDVTIVEGHLIEGSRYCSYDNETRVLDLQTGELQAQVPGCSAGAGQDWFARGDGASVSVYLLS